MVEADFKSDQLETLVAYYLKTLDEAAVMERRAGEKRRLAAEYKVKAEELKIRADEIRKVMYVLGHASISIVTTVHVQKLDNKKERGENG